MRTLLVSKRSFWAGALAGALVLAVGAVLLPPVPVAAQDAGTLFINLTAGTEQPHRPTMAFKMAIDARAAGKQAVIFLNIDAPMLATTRYPETLQFGSQSVRALMAQARDAGVQFFVCPHCMAAKGITADDLIDGTQVSDSDTLWAALEGPVVSMSY